MNNYLHLFDNKEEQEKSKDPVITDSITIDGSTYTFYKSIDLNAGADIIPSSIWTNGSKYILAASTLNPIMYWWRAFDVTAEYPFEDTINLGEWTKVEITSAKYQGYIEPYTSFTKEDKKVHYNNKYSKINVNENFDIFTVDGKVYDMTNNPELAWDAIEVKNNAIIYNGKPINQAIGQSFTGIDTIFNSNYANWMVANNNLDISAYDTTEDEAKERATIEFATDAINSLLGQDYVTQQGGKYIDPNTVLFPPEDNINEFLASGSRSNSDYVKNILFLEDKTFVSTIDVVSPYNGTCEIEVSFTDAYPIDYTEPGRCMRLDIWIETDEAQQQLLGYSCDGLPSEVYLLSQEQFNLMRSKLEVLTRFISNSYHSNKMFIIVSKDGKNYLINKWNFKDYARYLNTIEQ